MGGYIKHKKLGEGTYATIFLGVPSEEAPSKIVVKEVAMNDISVEDCVAIKQIKKSAYSTGQEISAVRELKALKNIKSPYVVQLKEVFIFQRDIFMILEYMECDLENILKSPSILIMPSDIKAWLYMLLCGLNECHKRLMIHRDIKPNNLLIGRNGYLKLGDFGLCRRVANDMTPGAITRWYRAPEMLLGASSYGFAADMWSVGAVFAEMFLRVPFFAGETDIQQLELIFRALGTPSEEEWPGMKELPGYFDFKRAEGPALEQLFSAATPDALDLMKKLLHFNPIKRITCQEALSHPYFSSMPVATEPRALPIVLRDLRNLPSVSSGDSL